MLLVSAIALIAATLALTDSVSIGGLRSALAAAPVADRIVTVRISAAAADAASISMQARPVLARTFARSGGSVVAIVRAGGLVVTDGGTEARASGAGSPSTVPAGTLLASYTALASHATLSSGRWPAPGRSPVEAVVSEGASRELGVRTGSTLVVADSLDPARAVPVSIAGVYAPARDDPYWGGTDLEAAGVERSGDITTRGPIVLAAEDLLAVAPRDVELDWRLLPDVAAIRPDDIGKLRDDVASLGDRLGAVLPAGARPGIATGLPPILGAIDRSLLVARTGVVLLALQFGILAGYAIVLVAAVLLERRQAGVRILRARGASGLHVVAMAIVEAVLLVVPAAALAPFLAIGVVDAIGSAGMLAGAVAPAAVDLRALAATGVAAGVAVVALSVPTVASVVAPGGLRIVRAGTTTLPQRLGVDLVLLVLAALGLWQLAIYGAPLTRGVRGTLGVDPLLVAAPAIGLLAGAVLAVRAVPRLAELAERLLGRARGAVPALGGRQLARRPLRYSRVALLLILAVAFGTYALVDGATWLASGADQAAYQAVGDIRVVASGADASPTTGGVAGYRGLPGVASAVPVLRGSISVGALRDGQYLAVDPAAAAALGGPGWDRPVLAALSGARLRSTAVPLPAATRRLALTIDAGLAISFPGPGDSLPLDPATRAISAAVVVVDRDGLIRRIAGGDAAIGAGRQRVEIPLPGGGPGALATPIRLEAVELTFSLPPGSQAASGPVDLRSVETSTDAGGDGSWAPVGGLTSDAGWAWRIEGTHGSLSYTPPVGEPDRIRFPLATPFSGAPGDLSDGLPVTVRLQASPGASEPLPAVAGPALLDATGARVGDVVTVSAAAVLVRLRIVGTVERLAPLDPSAAFLVVDGPSLALRRFVDTGDALAPAEWWLSVVPDAEASVLPAVRSIAPPDATVVGRAERTAASRDDPVAVGVIGALGLGALAAAVFAIVGLLVSATASTAERMAEFALLEALGLSRRELRASLILEHAFLLAVGLAGGVLLGLVLAWAVLPFATLTASGGPPVPPPTVVVPWPALVPLALAGLVMLGAAVAVALRQLGRRPVADLLREWEA